MNAARCEPRAPRRPAPRRGGGALLLLLVSLAGPALAPRVSRADDPADAMANALRVARKLHDHRLVESLLSQYALRPRATERDIREVVALHEGAGEPEAAVEFLRKRVEAYPGERMPVLLLAEVCARSDHADEAIRHYEAARARFGLAAQDAHRLARLLVKRGQLARALEVLKASVNSDASPPAEALRDLAAVAWELDDADAARDAYSRLRALGADTRDDLSRLIALSDEGGYAAAAVDLAASRFERERRADDLLALGQLQQKYAQWDRLATTLALAARRRECASNEAYWRLRLALHLHEGARAELQEDYKKILTLDPASADARAGLLWSAIDGHDTNALARYASVLGVPGAAGELRRALAAALDALGRSNEAARLFALEFLDGGADETSSFDLASALERAGSLERARRLRAAALARLQARLLADLSASGPLDEPALHRLEERALLARTVEGVDAGERWFRALVARAPREAQSDFAVAWSAQPARPSPDDLLDQGRDDEALLRLVPRLSQGATIDEERSAREGLRELAYRKATTASAGGSYTRLGGLETDAVEASLAHAAGSFRLQYAASGRLLASRGADVALSGSRREADFSVTGRLDRNSALTAVEAAVNVQASGPAPRVSLRREDRWSRAVGSALTVEVNGLVYNETPALRLGGLRDRLELETRTDLPASLYIAASGEGFEDHARDYRFAGAGAREQLELGLRISPNRPELRVGIEGTAMQRRNAHGLPEGDLSVVQPAGDALPGSYTAVSVVAHVGHGDWRNERHRDYRDFPRFGCDGSFGVLLDGATLAGFASCAVNARVTSTIFARTGGVYAFGVAGVPHLAYGSLFLAVDQTF